MLLDQLQPTISNLVQNTAVRAVLSSPGKVAPLFGCSLRTDPFAMAGPKLYAALHLSGETSVVTS